MAKKVYCIDSSALIHGWRRAYPPKRFASLWTKIDELIEQGRLITSIEIYSELEKKDDDLFAWAKERKATLFREIDDDVQDAVVYIMGKYPKLVDTSKGKSGGDPFVIAQAIAANPPHCVISQELGGSANNPKIPSVCGSEGLICIDLLTLIESEDWVF